MDVETTAHADSKGTATPVDQLEDVEVEPTTEELKTLEHTCDRFPLTAWLVILSQLCEAFAYFSTFAILQNYIQFPESDSDNKQRGALDLGQRTATAMTTSYYLVCNLTPIVGAIVADQFWGKYKTMVVASSIYTVGFLLLVLTSIPVSIKSSVALPGLICAMVILAVGMGGVKSVAGPLMAEQYRKTKPIIKEIKNVKKIIDPEITVQSLFSWLYWAINIGVCTGSIITTVVEKHHSFWLAFLVPFVVFPVSLVLLFIGHRRYIRVPPTGSLLIRVFHIISRATENRWKMGKQVGIKHFLDFARRDAPVAGQKVTTTKIDHQIVDDLKQTVHASRVFVLFPFFWVCYNQICGNLISQAAQMNVGPVPNDVLTVINPFTIVILIPLFDKVIYPALRRCNIMLNPIQRITGGFFVIALAMAWTAIVQHLIYSTGPNFNYAVEPCSTCQKFNSLSVAWQIPSYVLLGISEVFAGITALEYAFTNAPPTMKSVVLVVYLCTVATGSALGLALVPVSVDPKLVWMYTSLATVSFVVGIIFYILFRNDGKQTLPVQVTSRRASIVSVHQNCISSTTSGLVNPSEEQPLPRQAQIALPQGNGQSKYVSEHLCWTAQQLWNVPVNIFRVGQISGDTHNGIRNSTELAAMMIYAGAGRLHQMPDVGHDPS